MKNTRIVAKIVAVVAVVAVIMSSAVLLFACNKDKKPTLNDIFKSATSEAEFKGTKLEIELPAGWEVYTNSGTKSTDASNAYSDVGYIKDMNAFVVMHTATKTLSIMKCGSNELLFDLNVGISALRVKDGLIVCKCNNESLMAFDYDGYTVLSRDNFADAKTTVSIDTAIKILDSGLIAVHYSYDKFGAPSYTSIYRPTYTGNQSNRGQLVCRVSNTDNKLSNVRGFDGKYVTVVGNSIGNVIYKIPSTVNGSVESMNGTPSATFVSEGQSNYYNEFVYLGGGRFYVYEEHSVKETDDYGYYDGDKYYSYSRYIYTPDNDSLTEYTANADKVFFKMSNNYYDADKIGIDTNSYLNDGYIYASYGLDLKYGKDDAAYDQFILDSNLNIVMSLTGNYGVKIKAQKKDKVGYYDLVMANVDGYFYIPLSPSEIHVYDPKGNEVGHGNKRSTVVQQELSNNVIVAAIPDPSASSSSSDVLYGAFNIYGDEIIPFEYFSLSAFRGAYTIGECYNSDKVKSLYIIGNNGVKVEKMSDGSTPLADMATDKNNAAISKIGCYMYFKTIEVDGKNKKIYGIKNFNPNINEKGVMEARMDEGSILYAPSSSPSDVFVFEKITDENKNSIYHVYRLI